MHKHWHTHKTENRLTRLNAQHILRVSLLKHFWWRLSEFSVNMHALWLKHLSFPLVLYHTVLHSACSSNHHPETNNYNSTTLDLTKKKSHKQFTHAWLWGEYDDYPPLYPSHTSGEEISRDTNTSESDQPFWSDVLSVDRHNKTHTDMIWLNSGHLSKNKFIF